MIRIGDHIPDIDLRTDEGTPISLTDLKGRSLILFMLGETFTPTVERLLNVIAQNTGRFLALNMSPIAVLGEPASQLGAFRERNDVPFIMISDPALVLHRHFIEKDGHGVEVWITDEEGVVIEMIPMLPPTELVSVTVDRARRLFSGTVKTKE
ncbi:MAG: redoxin domain-containing protein [Proteobacteria bacterium]|nr:redoxin domain-containing protein [Pseudomonadota bacterium]